MVRKAVKERDLGVWFDYFLNFFPISYPVLYSYQEVKNKIGHQRRRDWLGIVGERSGFIYFFLSLSGFIFLCFTNTQIFAYYCN